MVVGVTLTATFVERFRAEIPARLHSRDTSEGGTPEFHRGFLAYLTDGERGRFATHVTDETDHCQHPTLAPGDSDCPTCEGTGLRTVTRHSYRVPVKRALYKLHGWKVPPGRPPFDTLLWTLGCADGDLGITMGILAAQYPMMADYGFAYAWTLTALRSWQRVFTVDAPAKVLRRDKSENQLAAEAA